MYIIFYLVPATWQMFTFVILLSLFCYHWFYSAYPASVDLLKYFFIGLMKSSKPSILSSIDNAIKCPGPTLEIHAWKTWTGILQANRLKDVYDHLPNGILHFAGFMRSSRESPNPDFLPGGLHNLEQVVWISALCLKIQMAKNDTLSCLVFGSMLSILHFPTLAYSFDCERFDKKPVN